MIGDVERRKDGRAREQAFISSPSASEVYGDVTVVMALGPALPSHSHLREEK